MGTKATQTLLNLFDQMAPRLSGLGELTTDVDATLRSARAMLADIASDIAYADAPEHPMAANLFPCAVHLAIYRALAPQGVDVHEFGRQVLQYAETLPAEPALGSSAGAAAMIPLAEQSQTSEHPGEFVFEFVGGEEEAFGWGMNMTSCAVCALFSQHDAMQLVPYMCATDDVMSDKSGWELTRTGTIALGASHCDFRFKAQGEHRQLAAQYPDKIRVID